MLLEIGRGQQKPGVEDFRSRSQSVLQVYGPLEVLADRQIEEPFLDICSREGGLNLDISRLRRACSRT